MLDMGIIKVEFSFPELKEAITNLEQGRRHFFDLLTRELKSAASNARVCPQGTRRHHVAHAGGPLAAV